MNLFITGTDTGVGKTTAAAWICSHVPTVYWKFIQTGDDSDTATIQRFAPQTEVVPELYRLKAPLSPYDAAQREQILLDTNRFQTARDGMVIEGAGGVLVPITPHFSMLDAIAAFRAKALVVARARCGMINHILLTINALRQKNIPVVGLIVCGDLEASLRHTIELLSGERILQILPESSQLEYLLPAIPVSSEILEILQ